MESSKSSDSYLKAQVTAKKDVDLWGFSEVRNENSLKAFEAGAEESSTGPDTYDYILGSSGGSDRLGIVYNKQRLELEKVFELHRLREGSNNQRAALVARFKGKVTGQRFLFMVNHLARKNWRLRERQAEMLNKFVDDEELPVIAVGDYNMDLEIPGGFTNPSDRGAAYDKMVKDGKWRYIRPGNAVKTQKSDDYDSILDFVFVANPPEHWTAASNILNRAGDDVATEHDFDEAEPSQESDHRPVSAVFTLSSDDVLSPPAAEPDRDEILKRIDAIIVELDALRKSVKGN